LHAGESTWEHNQNIYDAVLVNVKRIGHGTNLFFFPALEKEVRKRNICIEINPISNQLLGFVPDLRMHPAHTFINNGIQISVSSDDPSIFNYTGVSLDYWSIFLAWEIDLKMLKKIIMNSLDYCLLAEDQKIKAKQVWQNKWTAFIRYVNETL
jgi:adenosine deaminase CECR1